MSALAPEAAIAASRGVPRVLPPKRKFDLTPVGARIGHFPRRSLDHLVGAREERLRDYQADCLGGLEIDDQLEGGRLLDRQIRWLGAFQLNETVSRLTGWGGVPLCCCWSVRHDRQRLRKTGQDPPRW